MKVPSDKELDQKPVRHLEAERAVWRHRLAEADASRRDAEFRYGQIDAQIQAVSRALARRRAQ